MASNSNPATPTAASAIVSLDAMITPFLKKLLTLTSTLPKSIGGWDDKGEVFIVVDGEAFELLLRNYFKGTLQTFIRQLHFYGFSKSDLPKLGSHSWSFSHSCFLRDSPNLIVEIRRRSSSSRNSPKLSPRTISSKRIHKKVNRWPEDDEDEKDTDATDETDAESSTEVETDLSEIKSLKMQVTSLQETINKLLSSFDINVDCLKGETCEMSSDCSKPKKMRLSKASSSSYEELAQLSISSLTSALAKETSEMELEKPCLKRTFSSLTESFINDIETNGMNPFDLEIEIA